MNISTSAGILRRLPAFHNVSLRLLQDLVEFASARESRLTLPETGAWIPPETEPGDIWYVLRGELEVQRRGDVNWVRRVRAGDHHVVRDDDEIVRPAPGSADVLRVRRFPKTWMDSAMDASMMLARTVSRSGLQQLGIGDTSKCQVGTKAPPLVQHILLTHDPAFEVPLEALGRLLAAGIAEQFHENAVVLMPNASSLVTPKIWRAGRFHLRPEYSAPLDSVVKATDEEVATWFADDEEPNPGIHVVTVAAAAILPRVQRGAFHRIIYLTRDWDFGQRVPIELFHFLNKEAWNPERPDEGPFFSSFIPTVIVPEHSSRAIRRLLTPPPSTLHSLSVLPVSREADFTERPEPIAPEWRLYRDLCRVRLELTTVERLWHQDPEGCTPAALGRHPAASIQRWARAVTNRQVGIALSGGGAINALLVPLLEDLVERQVPIDVVSGVSGGTLLGAFLCKDVDGGLKTYVRQGLTFFGGFLGATVHSAVFQRVLDWLLDGERVEYLERRLVAITTELRDDADQAVRAVAVARGSLGQAIRVSGAAPGLFGPAANGRSRFIDGATSLGVPARILPDFGADIVFSFNAIGAVRDRNLLRAVAWTPMATATVDLFYQLPIVGRIVDSLVGQYALLQQASRADVEDADVFYEAPSETLPIAEGFQWPRIPAFVREAQASRSIWKPISDRCVGRWEDFRRAAQVDVPVPRAGP